MNSKTGDQNNDGSLWLSVSTRKGLSLNPERRELLNQQCDAILSTGVEGKTTDMERVVQSAVWPNPLVYQLFVETQKYVASNEHDSSSRAEPDVAFYRLALRHLLHLKLFELSFKRKMTDELLNEFGEVLVGMEHLIFESKGRRKPARPLKIAIMAAGMFFLIEQCLDDIEYAILHRRPRSNPSPRTRAATIMCNLLGLEYGTFLEAASVDKGVANFQAGLRPDPLSQILLTL